MNYMLRRAILGLIVTLLVVGVIAVSTPTAAMNGATRGELAISAWPGWSILAGTEDGRYEVLWVAAQNKTMDSEALSRTKQYRDYSVWKDISSDRVLVRVSTAFSPGNPGGSSPEAAFPLDWSRAQRLPDDWGFEVWQLTFVVHQIPYIVVAHIGLDASPLDRAAVRAVIASVRSVQSERGPT